MLFLFSFQFDQNFLVNTVSSSHYVKLSLPVLLKCLLILASYRHFSYENTCIVYHSKIYDMES